MTETPAPYGVTGGKADVPMGAETLSAGHTARNRAEGVSTAMPRSWTLWLPAMQGPARKAVKTIAGVKYTTKIRRPELPPSPNDRMHWRQRGPIVKAWRDAARRAAEQAGIPLLARIRFSAVIRRTRLGHADEDNDRARCKPLIDGLRDAGVIANDTRGFIEHGTVTEEKGPVGVLLIVEEAA